MVGATRYRSDQRQLVSTNGQHRRNHRIPPTQRPSERHPPGDPHAGRPSSSSEAVFHLQKVDRHPCDQRLNVAAIAPNPPEASATPTSRSVIRSAEAGSDPTICFADARTAWACPGSTAFKPVNAAVRSRLDDPTDPLSEATAAAGSIAIR